MRLNFGKLGLICLALILGSGAMAAGVAYFSDSATLTAIFTAGEWELGGSAGFWKNWDKHKTFTEGEIEGWLESINDGSSWLGPTTVGGMGDMLWQKCGPDMKCKFLKQYLATRLNAEAGRLYYGTLHNFSIYDSIDYLGLGGQGTLQEVISAIEGKYGTSPSEDQFEIMKDICEALNELEI